MILYCVVVLVCTAIIAVCNVMFNTSMSTSFVILATILSVVAVVIVDAIIALIVSRTSDKKFNVQAKIYNISKRTSKFYEWLKIKSWKDKVVELGALNHFRKNKIKDPNNNEYLNKFLIESAKGIWVHLLSMFLGFLIIFILPLKYSYCIGIYVAFVNLVLNLLPLMILQYNIPKLKVMIKYNNRHQKV